MGRPVFPKRAVITGGMPYGNKSLHFGHVGGMYVHADTFARFLRDRIGKENVSSFPVPTVTVLQLRKVTVRKLKTKASPEQLKITLTKITSTRKKL